MPNVIETARALAVPGRPFDSTEVRALVAGAEAIAARGGPRDDTDRRIVAIAEKMALYPPTPNPQPEIPKALLEEIEAAELAMAAEWKKTDAALAVLAAAQHAANYAKPNEQERARIALRAAEEAYKVTVDAKDRVGRGLLRLRLRVDGIRRAFAMSAHRSTR